MIPVPDIGLDDPLTSGDVQRIAHATQVVVHSFACAMMLLGQTYNGLGGALLKRVCTSGQGATSGDLRLFP